jgi:glycosyltransferase involved in cell wall biosynthesis
MREKVSACIMTLNEEVHIERCLKSVQWCDEIVVVDSRSSDRTVEICRRYTDRIIEHGWEGYIAQRNFVRTQATYPWVLFLDADEEVSAALRDDLLAEIEHGLTSYVGYQFPRRVHYLGAWIKWGEWNPDIKLRFFRKDCGYSAGEEPHDKVIVDGPVKTLKSPLFHYTYDSMTDHVNTLNRFSSISAEAKYKAGYRFRWIDFIFRPAFRFFKGFWLKAGFLDGQRGLMIALLSSWGVAMKYAKVWECQLAESDGAKSAAKSAARQEER